MLIVSALSLASDSLSSVSPIAAPAAPRMAINITASPVATSHPKNAAPRLKPPYSSR